MSKAIRNYMSNEMKFSDKGVLVMDIRSEAWKFQYMTKRI